MTTTPKPDVYFVLTREGQLGIGYCPDEEAGGIHIFKWVPDDMLKEAYLTLLEKEVEDTGD